MSYSFPKDDSTLSSAAAAVAQLARTTAAPPTDPHLLRTAAEQQQMQDDVVRTLPTSAGLLGNELLVIAKRGELSLVWSGVPHSGTSVSDWLRREAHTLFNLKRELLELDGEKHGKTVEENAAEIEKAILNLANSARFFEHWEPTARHDGRIIVEQFNNKEFLNHREVLHNLVDHLVKLCGVPRPPESMNELILLLHGVIDDARWPKEFNETDLQQKPRTGELKVYLNRCIAAIEAIHEFWKRAGPLRDSGGWENFERDYFSVSKAVWELASWTSFKVISTKQSKQNLSERKVDYLQQCNKRLKGIGETISHLGWNIGLEVEQKFEIKAYYPLAVRRDDPRILKAAHQAASLARDGASFTPQAAMSQRRANIYALL